MKYIIRFFIYLISFSLASLLAFLLFVFTTQSGLRLSFALANQLLDHSLQVKTLEGRLLTGFKLTNFSYQDKQHQIRIAQLDLKWSLFTLFKRKFSVEKLIAQDIHIQWPSSKKVSVNNNHNYLWLIKNLELNNIHLKTITVKLDPNVPTIAIKQLQLRYLPEKNIYSINTEINAANNHLFLKAYYDKSWAIAWNIKIPELKTILPHQQGRIISQGHIDSRPQQTTVIQHTEINDLTIQSHHIKQLTLNTTGKLRAHRITGKLVTEQQQVDIDLTGHYIPQHWQGIINHFIVKHEQQRFVVPLTNTAINIDYAKKNLQLKVESPRSAQHQLSAKLLLPQFSWQQLRNGKQKMNANIKLFEKNLSLITALFPKLTKPQGQVTLTAAINGTIKQPQYKGELQLVNGQAEFSQLGIVLHDAHLSIKSDNKQQLLFQGSVRSGKGTLHFTGQTDLNKRSLPTKLKLNGEQFDIIHNTEYQATISPQLDIAWLNKKLRITGTVKIPKALISPHDFSQSKELSNDAIFVDDKTNTTDSINIPIKSDITLELGDNIQLNVEGLTGQIKGRLTIQEHAKQTTTASGDLEIVNGKYQAYGQTLVIREGRLLFTGGSIENPGIRVSAIRKITLNNAQMRSANCQPFSTNPLLPEFTQDNEQKITVGIRVSGTLNDRQVSLFADPSAFSQADMLSLLIIGQPLCQVQQNQTQLLVNAVSALNFTGGVITQIKDQLSKTFGLDELAIAPVWEFDEETSRVKQGASVILGKALTSRLYVNYIFNSLTSDQIIRVKYRISKRWLIQSEKSSSGNAADIIYTFER